MPASMEIRPCVKWSLKQWKIIQPSAPKSGRARLQEVVVYERFQLEGFDCKNFGVKSSPRGGVRRLLQGNV